MLIKLFRPLAAVALSICISPAFADWSKSYDVAYSMGDADNKTSARQAAIEQIKLKAAAEAGTYIEGTTTLHSNGSLSETIQMLSASMVHISAVSEKMSVSDSGQAVLNISATASVDETELEHRITVMQQDKVKAKQIKQLQDENISLTKELSSIRLMLASQRDQAKIAELLSRQDLTIRKLAGNDNIVTQVFEKGTLIQLAGHNSDAYAAAKKDLDDNFYPALLDTKISASIESVEENGGSYVALVRIGWNFDTKRLVAMLAPYVNTENYNNQIIIYSIHNNGGKGPSNLSPQLYRYLAEKGVDLQLSILEKKVSIPVFYWEEAFSSCGLYSVPRRGEMQQLCLPSQKRQSRPFMRFRMEHSIRSRFA